MVVTGNFSSGSFTAPTIPFVGDAQVKPAAGISASKVQTRISKIIADNNSAAASSYRRTIWRVFGATCAVQSFRIGIAGTAAVGAATVTVDLLKNGVTILTATVVINNSVAQYGSVAASLAAGAASLVAGDVLDVAITAAAGGGTLPNGFFATLVAYEDPS
jgi:hypothetical protein